MTKFIGTDYGETVQSSDYSNDIDPEKTLQEIVDLPTWETLQQRYLAEALENARHSIEDDILILEYLSKWKIYHIPTASYRQATVRVYESQLFTEMNQIRLESKRPFNYEYRLMLYDEELIIGYGDISFNEMVSSNNLVIHDLFNLRPAEYSKVGSAVLKELIISIVEESKQFDGTQNGPIADFWKTSVKNLPITLTSVFEALLFYDKHFFLLSKPEALILSHPHVPQFFPGTLEGIEKFKESTHISDYDDYLKHYKDRLLKYGIPISAVGITERFRCLFLPNYYFFFQRKGTPTELDWHHLMLWDDYNYINYRLDYTDFKNEFPDLTDYLDQTRWLEPAKVVLEKERARFQLTKGKYKGMHQDIPMYLDRESFLDKFSN